jgi:hypothetical protein
MKLHHAMFAGLASLAMAAAPAFGEEAARILQGKSLFGEPLYTSGPNPVNVGETDKLVRAVAEAKAAYERDLTIDSATWYGRLLAYQGLMREAIQVYTAGLKKFPDSAKLLRHRAHRYFNLREFDRSIEDGLRAAALYQNRPLEREKLGPDYFPSTPDVVQFYLYYHLGQAYFAKHDYPQAAAWFDRSRQVVVGVDDVASVTAATYWQYLALARGGQYDDAGALLDRYTTDLVDLRNNDEANYYFEGMQLFKNRRDPARFFDDKDSGKAFGTADGIKASTSYSLANYYLVRGYSDEARAQLKRALSVATWSYFARVQAEADWVYLYGNEKP